MDGTSFSVRVSFESLSELSLKSIFLVGDSSSEGVVVGLLRFFFWFFVEEEPSCSSCLAERFIALSFISELSECERRKLKLCDVEFVAIGVALFVPDPVVLERVSPTVFNSELVVFGVDERKFVEGEPSRLLGEFMVASRGGMVCAFHVLGLLRTGGSADSLSVRCVPWTMTVSRG